MTCPMFYQDETRPRRRGTPLHVACIAALALVLGRPGVASAAPAAAAADELPPITVGRLTVGWSAAGGLSLACDGVPVVRKSTLNIVKQGWAGTLLSQSTAPRTVTAWEDAPGGKTARVRLENDSAVCVYTINAAPAGTVSVDLAYRLKQDAPAEIEYAAGYLSAPLLQGAALTAATTEGDRTGRVAVAPPPAGRTQEQNRLVPPFTQLAFDTRLGRFSVSFSGNAPPPVLFDARSDAQTWAQEFPVFWMGVGSPAQPLTQKDGERVASFSFVVGQRPLPRAPFPEASGKGEKEGTRTADVLPLAEARAPVPPPAPLVIPRPKQMTVTARPFRIRAGTRIVVADGATAEDKQGAEILRKEVRDRFGLDLPLVRARAARGVVNVIAVGEPGRNALLGRLLAAEKAAPPAKAEGYAVAVTPRAVLVAGRDRRGTLWGVQTLIQLLAADKEGVQVRPVRIADWPTLPLRAVHLFHGQEALPFHKNLIDRVLMPFKMNALFLQAEQLRWDADPAVAPPWAGRKEQVREEIAYARRRGITAYPLVQSMGHMEWLFAGKRNLDYAEDPQTPYALNTTDPRALAHLERIVGEADDLFGAPAFHIGHDEVMMRGRFPHRSAPRTFADLFVASVKRWRDFFARRGKPVWMWADMALHPSAVAPSFGTAPSPEVAARIRAELPKDVVLVDWQYGAHERFPSLALLKDAGFRVVAATWFNPANIQNFAREAAKVGALGALQTTWAGYESKEAILDTPHRRQFSAMVLAAEYFWNGGAGPAPDDLPYNADEVFNRQWEPPSAADARARRGFAVDLSALATRPLPDWLGYGAENGLSAVPTGDQRLADGTLYRIPSGVLLLDGKLNPPGAYPATRQIPLLSRLADAIVARQVDEVCFVVATSHAAAAGAKVGTINFVMEGGKTHVVDLVYGKNIAAATDATPLPGALTVWKGRTPAGQPVVLRRLRWKNPEPDLPLRAVTVTSTRTEAAPAVFAVTALE